MIEVASQRPQGSCDFYKPQYQIDLANMLVAADEPMRALRVLSDMMPAYYRDQPPPELIRLMSQIHWRLATPAFYMKNIYDMDINVDNAVLFLDTLLRGQMIQKDVKDLNDQGKTPHIIDLGPGEYFLPIGLSKKGYNFTYQDIGLCGVAQERAKPHIEQHFKTNDEPVTDRPVIFVGCEILEHLHHEADIAVDCLRANGGYTPDIIHISTPYGTYDGREDRINWMRYGDIGHLRTYTTDEFGKVVSEMFPRVYDWVVQKSQPMHIRGITKKMS